MSVTVVEIKKQNRNDIYSILHKEGNLSKQEIVNRLRLSLPTVTMNINELLAENLIIESGSSGNAVGRKAIRYSINKTAKVAFGIDITKHHITVLSVNLAGETLSRNRVYRLFSLKESYHRYVGELLRAQVEENGFTDDQILGVGIGIPGLTTTQGREIFYGMTMMNFCGLKVENFERFIPYTCAFIKDANAACLAETWLNPEMDDAFYISLSNYVGGSVRLYGEPYGGDGPRSGEVGHIRIIPNGRKCYCGQKGCVDPYCSALRLTEGLGKDEDLDIFFKKLEQKDPECEKTFTTYLYHLALAVNNTRMLFDCNIILGGYVGAYMDAHLAKLKGLLANLTPFEDNADYVQVCKWKSDAIAAGAAIRYIDEFIKAI
ncbi:MAG: ROK family transcriptional regulator [Clostridiales Family XIII bacterium]|jgi:predicted NBD/HSP70 family sugar kinase|nr:ROK family transcriptional regulator [Clostridiales Family XIII bacterium]